MTKELHVVKRNGCIEALDYEKIHKVVTWACDGLSGVSVSEIEMNANIQLHNKIKTHDIHETLIKSASSLIDPHTPNYQFVAARLVMFDLRKKVYGRYDPCTLLDLIERNVKKKKYDSDLLKKFTTEEIDRLDSYIKHQRDLDFSYAASQQLTGKYLVQNRDKKGEYYETPQMMYMLIAMTLFIDDKGDDNMDRIQLIKAYYDAVSTFKLGIPTPILAGARTPTRQFSSCVLIDTDDNLNSITATNTAIVKYISQKAGIGGNFGKIRPEGSSIRGGDAMHTGLIPFLKHFQAAVKSCSQGGVRGGSATVYYPIWHRDVEELLVLKNNRGTDEKRVRHLDYGVQLNRLFYKRLVKGQNITLFAPIPDLYDAFVSGDNDAFEALYEKYEKTPGIDKKVVPAADLFSLMMIERKGTGRIYIQNIDHCNNHTPFRVDRITMSNLCSEIALPTKPFKHEFDEEGRIALCTLSSFNWGTLTNKDEMELLAKLVIRSLDNLLSYQDYPMIQAKLAVDDYRALGIGINNLAYFLAKNGLRYQDGSANELVNEWSEAMAYYLQKATIELAEERGPCKKWKDLEQAEGRFVIDTYNKNVDTLVSNKLHYPWDALRVRAIESGVRNATVTAHMPSESNSQLMNATSGIEPARALVTKKQSKDGILAQVVPNIHNLKNKYDMLWDQKSPQGYLDLMCIIQKFTDQTISANTSYNPNHYADNDHEIPMSVMLKDLLRFYKFGGKTLYYFNTNDALVDKDDENIEKRTEIEVIQEDPESCESCKL